MERTVYFTTRSFKKMKLLPLADNADVWRLHQIKLLLFAQMITRVTQNSEKDGVGCTVETSSSHKLMVWHLSGSSWILDHFNGIEFGRGSTSCRHLNRFFIALHCWDRRLTIDWYDWLIQVDDMKKLLSQRWQTIGLEMQHRWLWPVL